MFLDLHRNRDLDRRQGSRRMVRVAICKHRGKLKTDRDIIEKLQEKKLLTKQTRVENKQWNFWSSINILKELTSILQPQSKRVSIEKNKRVFRVRRQIVYNGGETTKAAIE